MDTSNSSWPELEMELPTVPTGRYKLQGRKPRQPEMVRDEVKELTKLLKKQGESAVAQWLRHYTNARVDDELEVMAIFILSEWDHDVDVDEVRNPLAKGQHRTALNVLLRRVREEVATMLREHKRGEADQFFDAASTMV